MLLKNPEHAATKSPVLPLSPTALKKIALIGPHVHSQKDLAGNYFEEIGVGTCAGPTCITTIAAAMAKASSAELEVLEACSDVPCKSANISGAIEASAGADAIVLAMGISGVIEGEGHDRMDIGLPGMQYNLTKALIEAYPATPIVLLLFNGGTRMADATSDHLPCPVTSCYCRCAGWGACSSWPHLRARHLTVLCSGGMPACRLQAW